MSQQRFVKDLDESVLRKLSILLNPRMVIGGYWKTMAGRFGLKIMEILYYEGFQDPTLAVLKDWWDSGKQRTVTELIYIMKDIERNDAVRLLRPFELYEIELETRDNINEKKVNIPKETIDFHASDNATNGVNGHANGQNIEYALPASSVYSAFSRESVLPVHGERTATQNECTSSSNGIHSSDASQRRDNATINGIREGIQNQEHTSSEEQPRAEGNESSDDLPTRGSGRHFRVAETSMPTQMPNPACQMNYSPFPSFPSIFNNLPADSGMSPRDKVALVIGNQNYKRPSYNKLCYVLNDALDMKVALERLQFKVITLGDLCLSEMRTSMLAFCRLLGPNIYALFYYAGHGYELDGENYLLPVDAESEDPNGCIRAQEYLQEMQNCDTFLNVMFLDCCRTRLEDAKLPRVNLKRRARGNTIIAFSCCSQHRSYELPDERNGLYARHLLNHICRDKRIENILLDVNAAVVSSDVSVEQRPTFESDAYTECRLTAKIFIEEGSLPYRERSRLWQEGCLLPVPFHFSLGSCNISLNCQESFNNVLVVVVHASSTSNQRIKDLRFIVEVFEPLKVTTKSEKITLAPSQKAVLGFFTIEGLQKLVNEQLLFVMEFESESEKHIKKLDFGSPLITGITGKFHEWITDRKYDIPSGSKTTWI